MRQNDNHQLGVIPKRGALFVVDGILKERLEETDLGNLETCSIEKIKETWLALLEIKRQRLSTMTERNKSIRSFRRENRGMVTIFARNFSRMQIYG